MTNPRNPTLSLMAEATMMGARGEIRSDSSSPAEV